MLIKPGENHPLHPQRRRGDGDGGAGGIDPSPQFVFFRGAQETSKEGLLNAHVPPINSDDCDWSLILESALRRLNGVIIECKLS